MNALVGEDRTIVSPVSGTTRDAIDTEYTGPDGEVFVFPFFIFVTIVSTSCQLYFVKVFHIFMYSYFLSFHGNETLLAFKFVRCCMHVSIVMQKFRLIDTAGIRRRAVVASSGSMTEALSVNRAFRAIRRSDVVALVIEAMACITEQVLYILIFLWCHYSNLCTGLMSLSE